MPFPSCVYAGLRRKMGQKARLVGDVDRVAAQLTPPGVGGPDDYTMEPHCLPQSFLALHALHKIFRGNDKFEKKHFLLRSNPKSQNVSVTHSTC